MVSVDPFNVGYLPPLSDLLIWRAHLGSFGQDQKPYIATNHGNFDLEAVQNAIKLHDAKSIKECVFQETSWFQSPPKRPMSVSEYPTNILLDRYQHLILNTPHNIFVENLSMKPGELAQLAHTRYISSDHVEWFTRKLNSQQNNSLCVYLNGVRDSKKYLSDHFKQQTNISFVINVGRLRDGDVFLASDLRPGCHWALVNYNNSTKSIFYADSLAWSPPKDLTDALIPWLNTAFGVSVCPDIIECHDSSSFDSSGQHICVERCSQYPLQTCGNICGPVVIMMTVIAAFSVNLFHILTTVSNTTSIPFLYLKEPTKYGKYLRQVMMAWIVSDNICVKNIIPLEYLDTSEGANTPVSDSDDDFEVATLSPSSSVSNSMAPVIKSADNRFHCSLCKSSYTRRNDLKRHMEKFHQQTIYQGDSVCLQCDFKAVHVEKLREHLSTEHGLKMEMENLTFHSYEEFEDWKCDLEEATNCSYVKHSGVKSTKHEEHVQHFKCNRSGKFKSKRLGRRRLKSSGSCKTDINCTSFLRVNLQKDGSVSVLMCRTHYGHATEVQNIRFNKRQRNQIAAKLSQGISRDKILDDIRDNVGFDFQKIYLLDRKDINNIKHAYNIDSIKRHENDQQSVLSWILDWKAERENPILYYNLQGEKSDYVDIEDEDFIIIIQTEAQKKLLQKFGKNGVCADATHGTTGYDFMLSTLLVIDEFGHGQPAAWCLATHETEEFLKIFFDKVVENSGETKPRWFMSDLAPQYYNAFCNANNCHGSKRLACSWHVDKAWKKALNEKVGNIPLEAELYLKLKTIQQITNRNLFESTFQAFVDQTLATIPTKSFGEYMAKNWINNRQEWSFCYRVGDGINTNMFVEAFHHTLRYKYLKRKHNRRVDVLLVNLIKFSRDQVFERLIRLTKGKETARQHLVHDRHMSSKRLSFSSVKQLGRSEDGEDFEVESEKEQTVYRVTKLADLCPINDCFLKCQECNVCIHIFQCMCPDYLIQGTSCKHIHLVKCFLDSRGNSVATSSNEANSNMELEETFDLVRGEQQNAFMQFSSLTSKVTSQLDFLHAEIGSCSSVDMDALAQLSKSLGAVTNTFISMKKNKNVLTLELKENFAPNKHIEIQQKFKSVMKRKQKTHVRLVKPTTLQQTEIITNIEDTKLLYLLGLSGADSSIKPEIIDFEIGVVLKVLEKNNLDENRIGELITEIELLKEDWKCGSCNVIKYIDMVECEECLTWFHWPCVSEGEPSLPVSTWCCSFCVKKTTA